ncbi:unnamed protein product, partial [Discosporangium mesarthrocarpum]
MYRRMSMGRGDSSSYRADQIQDLVYVLWTNYLHQVEDSQRCLEQEQAQSPGNQRQLRLGRRVPLLHVGLLESAICRVRAAFGGGTYGQSHHTAKASPYPPDAEVVRKAMLFFEREDKEGLSSINVGVPRAADIVEWGFPEYAAAELSIILRWVRHKAAKHWEHQLKRSDPRRFLDCKVCGEGEAGKGETGKGEDHDSLRADCVWLDGQLCALGQQVPKCNMPKLNHPTTLGKLRQRRGQLQDLLVGAFEYNLDIGPVVALAAKGGLSQAAGEVDELGTTADDMARVSTNFKERIGSTGLAAALAAEDIVLQNLHPKECSEEQDQRVMAQEQGRCAGEQVTSRRKNVSARRRPRPQPQPHVRQSRTGQGQGSTTRNVWENVVDDGGDNKGDDVPGTGAGEAVTAVAAFEAGERDGDGPQGGMTPQGGTSIAEMMADEGKRGTGAGIAAEEEEIEEAEMKEGSEALTGDFPVTEVMEPVVKLKGMLVSMGIDHQKLSDERLGHVLGQVGGSIVAAVDLFFNKEEEKQSNMRRTRRCRKCYTCDAKAWIDMTHAWTIGVGRPESKGKGKGGDKDETWGEGETSGLEAEPPPGADVGKPGERDSVKEATAQGENGPEVRRGGQEAGLDDSPRSGAIGSEVVQMGGRLRWKGGGDGKWKKRFKLRGKDLWGMPTSPRGSSIPPLSAWEAGGGVVPEKIMICKSAVCMMRARKLGYVVGEVGAST